MQLRVVKCDSSSEVYLHTKVWGSIAGAMADCDQFEAGLSEQLAEAVTTYVKRHYGCGQVSANEIHSMTEVVLSDTGYEAAALKLHEHRIDRQVKRARVRVIRIDGDGDMEHSSRMPEGTGQGYVARPWNKSIIVGGLVEQRGLSRGLARAVAGAVEERVLRLLCRTVTTALVRELVFNELLVLKQAELALLEGDSGDISVEARVLELEKATA